MQSSNASLGLPDSEGPNPTTRHILVVDDEPVAAALAARMLKAGGYTTTEVVNAREALTSLAQGKLRFDAVVTDVVMPETDGRTLGRIIGERHPGLPVIYVSAYPANDMFHRGAPGPHVPFLQKPFSQEQLLLMIRQQLLTGDTHSGTSHA